LRAFAEMMRERLLPFLASLSIKRIFERAFHIVMLAEAGIHEHGPRQFLH